MHYQTSYGIKYPETHRKYVERALLRVIQILQSCSISPFSWEVEILFLQQRFVDDQED
jgi:hypothetical protein